MKYKTLNQKGDNTMNLNPIKANMTELELESVIVLFSYKTPVATIFWYGNEIKAYQTEKKWSRTTSRHITQWLGLHPEVFGAQYKPQEYFDNLIAGIK